MKGTATVTRISTLRLIFYPALITLAVTLVRLAGELQHGSKTFFNPEQGGAWALVGIVWLVPIFGIYFAFRLARESGRPAHVGRAIGIAALGAIVFAAGFFLFQKVLQNFTGIFLMWTLAAVGGGLQVFAWRRLFKVLAAYAYAARIPVAVVMFVATLENWPSHYNANVLGFSPLAGFFLFGFIPQLVWWVSFTIVVGMLVGAVAATLTNKNTEDSTSHA